MAETKDTKKTEQVAKTKPAKADAKGATGNKPGNKGTVNIREKKANKSRAPRQERKHEFDTFLIKIRRVSRMYKGGRRMRLSVFVAVGDREGKVGLGLGHGADVSSAQRKAVERAKKAMIFVPLKGDTLPHEVELKYKATQLMLKPAAPGTGVVAGGTVKAVLELAGVKDVLSKVLGSNNQINVARATYEALKQMQSSRL